jgi:hypothetical protein
MTSLTFASLAALGLSGQALAGQPEIGFPSGLAMSYIGVATHLAYTDGFGHYADPALLQQDLAYLGVTRIRDGLCNSVYAYPQWVFNNSVGVLAKAGIKFDLILSDWQKPMSYDQALLDQLVAANHGAVMALEGLNEIGNEVPKPTFDQALRWQQEILALTQGQDPLLKGIQIVFFTGDFSSPVVPTPAPSASFPARFMNAHPYPYGGEASYPIIERAFQIDYGTAPPPFFARSPLVVPPVLPVITEIGDYVETYNSARTDDAYLNAVDATTAAKQTLQIIGDAFAVGSQVYLYQLLDNYPDPQDNQPDQEYGLFDANNDPTPAATAIHNLTSIFAGTETTTAPGPDCLEWSMSGAPVSAKSLLLQTGSQGRYAIMAWAEPPNWNFAQHAEVPVAPTNVTFGFTYQASGTVYDPVAGRGAVQLFSNQRSVTVPMTDHLLVLSVKTSNPGDAVCR